MLRKLRISLATLCLMLITLLFCDFTGIFSVRLAFLAKIQFVPALLSGAFAVVIALVIAALLFGRLYCSILCPLGILQDMISNIASRRYKNRFGWRPGKTFCRMFFFFLFAWLVVWLDPYSAFGRIASNLFAPIYRAGNNLLAYFAERSGSFAFYSTDVWMNGGETFAAAIATLGIVTFFAYKFGRLYCNTICPVGAILGFFAQFALFRPRIDTSKCNGCGLCAKNCKASCINPNEHTVDTSRCVVCFDCLEKCPQKAISFSAFQSNAPAIESNSAESDASRPSASSSTSALSSSAARRGFLSFVALSMVGKSALAQEKPEKKAKRFDGGLAPLTKRVLPIRTVAPLPPGGVSVRHFALHCSACQLCVSACPNQVLRPSKKFPTMMQPEMSFERGYCRPECVRCSEVCPAGAIHPMNTADKSATQIGYAVWVRDACIVITDDVECGNCERHCPTDAIEMIPLDPDKSDSRKIPTVNVERCIGCGACEHLCPARPTSAIYVEGVDSQRVI